MKPGRGYRLPGPYETGVEKERHRDVLERVPVAYNLSPAPLPKNQATSFPMVYLLQVVGRCTKESSFSMTSVLEINSITPGYSIR